MKITILGRGNAGCLTALHFGYYGRHYKDISIELIYDPDISPEKVGQATLLETPELLWKALGTNRFDNPMDATPKFGILYENWGKKNHKFFHPFALSAVALHCAPSKLQETILKSGYFNVKEEHIDNYNQIDSDYIFDCRGRHITNWEEYIMLTSPLNSVLLGEAKTVDLSQHWTRAVATPDGWTFVIPNTSQTTSYGYLYNDEITSTVEASTNFEKLFSLAEQGIYLNEKVDNFKFKSYVAKKPIIDDRIILSGNRLFFLEPLESTAIETYLDWARSIWDWIIEKETTPTTITQNFHEMVTQIQNFILWHYQFGSKYDTPFWESAKKLKIEDPVFDKVIKFTKSKSLIDLIQYEIETCSDPPEYFKWRPTNFKNWIEGVHP